tara:strand:+ start:4426 stop:4809 length:384 start_codon:yes stop_codon:yes gene_type:complete
LFDGPTITKQLSSQPYGLFGALRAHTDVIAPGASNVANPGELLAYLLGIRHQSLGDQGLNMLADLAPGLGVSIRPTPALGLVTGLHIPRSVGIVRPRPAHTVIPGVAQRIKQSLMARGGDIQRTSTR